jgi:hypothetical protein
MAGIDFMSFIEGQRLAEKDNRTDEVHAQEMLDKQQAFAEREAKVLYNERDQAFKEQLQGYTLKDWEEVALNKDAARITSQAYDTWAAAARAQNKPMYQVMLESPDFTVDNPALASRLSANMRQLVQGRIAPDLRKQGMYEEAGKLEQRFGLAVDQSTRYLDTQRALKDPVYRESYLLNQGFRKDADGGYVSDTGVKMSESQALVIASKPESAIQSLSNLDAINRNAAVVDTQAKAIEAKNAQAARNAITTQLIQAKQAGVDMTTLPPEYQAVARDMGMLGAATSAAPAAPQKSMIDSLTSQAPTTGWVTEQNNKGSASVSAAAAAAPEKESLSIGWREALPNSGYADPATGVVSSSEETAVRFKPSVIDSYRPDQWRTLLAEIDSGRMTSAPLDEQLKARAYLIAQLNREASRLKGLKLGY